MMQAVKGLAMEKWLCWGSMGVAGLMLLLFILDLAFKVPFGGISLAVDVLIILCIYPLLKAFHEMGHAYATKVWGGEVHEIGVMLLILIPIPYVDASASAAFAEKRRRIVVGGAGILIALLIVHVLAAIYHQFWRRDNVFWRISLRREGSQSGAICEPSPRRHPVSANTG